MVTNVTSLLKTVKAVEDEATRGTRALEATIECIKQELTVRNIFSLLLHFWGPISVLCDPFGNGQTRPILIYTLW